MATSLPLHGTHVLITAGPTREFWDPVRYLSNASSGQMGAALALEARRLGASVRVVLGPVDRHITESLRQARIRVIPVISAEDMLAAVKSAITPNQIFIATAAVADFRPKRPQSQKIKRGPTVRSLALLPNPDILALVARPSKGRPRVVIGFALETFAMEQRARGKLKRKNLDWIVANPAHNIAASSGKGILIGKNGERVTFPTLPKKEFARRLWKEWVINV